MLFASVLFGSLLIGCDRPGDADVPPATAAPVRADRQVFVDRTMESGLDFVHLNGMSGEYYFSEMMGAGSALFDYDNDGDLDLYLVQGGMLGEDRTVDDARLPSVEVVPVDRLFRNDLGSEASARFTDVTETSGLKMSQYGMGVATGDYDNDGWIDLYVTNFGANSLLHNNGDGTFTDVTEESGTGETQWSVPALFFDFDRDGWLDLFVGNYVDYQLATHKQCTSELGMANYCGPLSFRPMSDRLWRNSGDGTFEDVSGTSGIGSDFGGALGAVAADFNLDGWLDLYVGNDGVPNHLWINDAGDRFENHAVLAGCAVNDQGNAEASMGVLAADHDRDGDEDLFMSHLTGETNTLFVNDGRGLFEDRSAQAGLAANSLGLTSFGDAWQDFDGDGQLDLLIVSGAVKTIASLVMAGDPFPLHQTNQFYRGTGGVYRQQHFEPDSPFSASEVSRGVASGDVDNDGDVDVVVTNNAGPARLWINVAENAGEWLGLRLVDARGMRDMLGAWVSVESTDGSTQWRRVGTDGSYASARDPRLVFGLGTATGVRRVEVQWPVGGREEWTELEVGRYHELRQGAGSLLAEETP